MIDLDEIREPAKTNYTPIIVLGIIAMLMIVVGFISYKDYVDKQADKKVADSDKRIGELEKKLDDVVNAQNRALNQPAKPDPKLERYRQELLAAQNKIDTNSMMIEKVLQNTDPPTQSTSEEDKMGEELFGAIPPAILNPPGVQDPVITDSLRDSVVAAPGGMSRAAQDRLALLESRVRNSPAIGKVVYYNEEMNIVAINAGQRNNLRKGSRYLVKRGVNQIGEVQISEVRPTESIAQFVNTAQMAQDSIKPQVGDQVVALGGGL